MIIGVPTERAAHERRVALVPDSVARLVKGPGSPAVAVERGAGVKAGFPDAAYEAAGATITDAEGAYAADLLCKVRARSLP